MTNYGKKKKKEEETKNRLFIEPTDDPSKPRIRVVGLYGPVDNDRSAELIYQMLMMRDAGKQLELPEDFSGDMEDLENYGPEDFEASFQPFELYISTEGGAASDMFAVYDTIKMIQKDCGVETVGIGKVMSAGVLLLAAGEKGKRKIGRNCRVMIHNVSSGHHGSLDVLENELAEVKWIQERYIEALANETEMTKKQIRKYLKKNVNIYLDAEEAIELGIADEII